MAGPWEMYAPQQQAQPQQESPAWASNLSRKDQAEIQMKMYEEGRKRLAALQAQISDAGGVMSDLERYGELNRKSSTGSWWQQLSPDKQMFRSPESMEMLSIQSRLAPAQRQPGSGATSDRDIQLYLRGLPSIENDGNVNRDIRLGFQRNYDAAIAKANAMQEHLNKYGNLTDFDSVWAQRNQPQQPQQPQSAMSPGGWSARKVGQ